MREAAPAARAGKGRLRRLATAAWLGQFASGAARESPVAPAARLASPERPALRLRGARRSAPGLEWMEPSACPWRERLGADESGQRAKARGGDQTQIPLPHAPLHARVRTERVFAAILAVASRFQVRSWVLRQGPVVGRVSLSHPSRLAPLYVPVACE